MKLAAIATLFVGVLIAGAIVVTNRPNGNSNTNTENNVIFENGVQIIQVKAKGGFSPGVSLAKANAESVLRVKTESTFDCSASLVIPSLDYSGNLPFTGVTEIKIPPQKSGAEILGMCSMGMYNFSIRFE